MSSPTRRGISRDYLGWDRSVWSSPSLLEDDEDVNVHDGDSNDVEEEEPFGYGGVSSSSHPCV